MNRQRKRHKYTHLYTFVIIMSRRREKTEKRFNFFCVYFYFWFMLRLQNVFRYGLHVYVRRVYVNLCERVAWIQFSVYTNVYRFGAYKYTDNIWMCWIGFGFTLIGGATAHWNEQTNVRSGNLNLFFDLFAWLLNIETNFQKTHSECEKFIENFWDLVL